jgi:hypothetical protein
MIDRHHSDIERQAHGSRHPRAEGGPGLRGMSMTDKRADRASVQAVGVLAGLAAGFATRKLITAGWKKVTGKEPPSDPQDPHVSIGEALSWAIVLGVAMETARLVAIRVTTNQLRRNAASNGQ